MKVSILLNSLGGVVREATVRRSEPMVYFLCSGNRIIYIGSTVNLPSRVAAHRKRKKFSRVFYIPVKRGRMLQVEREMINAILPASNLKGIPPFKGRRNLQKIAAVLKKSGFISQRSSKHLLYTRAS